MIVTKVFGKSHALFFLNPIGAYAVSKKNHDARRLKFIPMNIMHRSLAICVEMADIAVGNQARLAWEDIRNLIEIVVRILEARPFASRIAWFRRKMDNRHACEMRLQCSRK